MISRPIVFFDLETGGLEPTSPIIQIAAVAVGFPSWEEYPFPFEKKIMFNEADAHPKALEINHYDRTVWDREAESLGMVLTAFSMWLRNYSCIELVSKAGRPYKVAQLAGYNSEGFDSSRLQAAFRNNGIYYPAHYRTLDVLQLAAWEALETGLAAPSLKLSDVCTRYGISVLGAHDALTDVRMTIELAKRIITPKE